MITHTHAYAHVHVYNIILANRNLVSLTLPGRSIQDTVFIFANFSRHHTQLNSNYSNLASSKDIIRVQYVVCVLKGF